MSSSTFIVRRPIRSMCLLSLVLLGVTACKPADEPDDGDQPATPIEADDAADVLAQQICAQLYVCDCSETLSYADEAECIAMETAEIAARVDAVLAAGGSWDPECAGHMAKAMSDWECLGPVWAEHESSFSPLTCPVLKGVLGLNQYCNRFPLGDDCQAGLLCVSGTCLNVPTVPVPVGQPCTYDLPCESGAFCNWDGNQEICIAQPEAGDPCSDEYPQCGTEFNDLVCDEATNICQPSPGEGESCELGLLCQPGLYCDGGQNFTCLPRRELGEGCGADAVCPIDGACVNNICEAVPAAVCNAVSLF